MMGKWKHIFVTVTTFKTGALIESFMTKIFLSSLFDLFSANLQNSVRCNMIDNRQVEIFSSSLNSIRHLGMVLVSDLVCYKYNIRGKREDLLVKYGEKLIILHSFSTLVQPQFTTSSSILQMMMNHSRSGCSVNLTPNLEN